MDHMNLLLDLEEPARQIRSGINAIGIMTMGLIQAGDPYADGFHAVWDYLLEADQELQKRVELCLSAPSGNNGK